MHRSGTSALTSALVACGCSIGKDILPPSFDNPKGFFENRKVLNFNDKILSALEMHWDSPLLLPIFWSKSLDLDSLKLELEEILHSEFEANQPILIKDPRTCLLFPVWEKLLQEYDICPIINVRDPKKVAQSLYSRNRFGQDKSSLLWINHYLSVEEDTENYDRILVDFDDLLKKPIEELKRVLKFIDDSRLVLDNSLKETIKNTNTSIKKDAYKILKNELSDLSTSIYSLLKNNKNQKKDNGLEQIKETYLQKNKLFIESTYRQDKKQFTLIAIDEDGKRLSDLRPINLGQNTLTFNVKSRKKIQEIILLPCNDNAYFKLGSVLLKVKEGDDNLKLSKKRILFEHGTEYVVNSRSFFQYGFDESVLNFKVEVQIFIHAYGLYTFNRLNTLSEKLGVWIDKNVHSLKSEIKSKNTIIEQHSIELQSYKNEFEGIVLKLENEIENNEKYKLNESLQEQIKKEKTTLENQYAALQNEHEEHKHLTSKAAKQSTKMKRKVIEIEEELKSIKKVNKDLVEQKSKGALDLSEATKELYKKDTEIEVLKLRLEHLEDNMQLKIDILKQGMDVIRKENEAYKESLIDHKQLQIDLIRAETKVESYADKIDIFQNLHLQAQSNLQKAHQSQRQLEGELQISNNISESLVSENEVGLKQKEQEHEQVVDELLLHLESLENNTVQLAELEELKNKFKSKEQELENLINDQDSKLDENENLILILKSEIQKSSEEIEDRENALSLKNTELENQRKELLEHKVDSKNRFRDLEDLKQSLSYKVGAGITSPARWVYDKTNGKTPLNKSKLWLIKNLVLGGIKNPISAVMKLSPKNLKTLHSAMKSESNETIIQNFNKLVDGNQANSSSGVEMPVEYNTEISEHSNSNPTSSNIISIPQRSSQSTDKTKVLYISPNLPDYDTSSGGKRATRMIEILCEQFEVYLFTLGSKPQKYIDKLTSFGAILIDGNDYMQIKRRIPKIDTIIFAWYYTFNDANKFVQLYTNAKIIVDSVDVHWVREERSIGMMEGLTEENVKANKVKEIEVYKQADLIWTVTENDKNNILREIENAHVNIVSNIHDNHVHAYEDNGQNTMLFFGGFNHYPNISAAKNIVNNILPIVRESIPDAKLILAGANAPDDIETLGLMPGVDYRGFIEEDQLAALYQESFLSVAPLLAGAGIKGKICEAIVYRTPVVTNAIGNEGIDMLNLQDGIIAEENNDLAQLIVRSMQREFDMNAITHNAQEKLKHIVGTESVRHSMFNSILPEVSICIVTWNRLDLLKRCIESIEGNTTYPNYKIIVHSNGCEDGTQEYLEAAASINKKIVPVLSKDNEVFVIPNNNMMQMFPDNDAVLVNNDVYVTKGWLTELYKAAYGNPNIGIAGSKILYPDQSLQEFGSELYENGSGRNIGKHDDPNKDEYKQMKRVGYVSGCSMYIKNKTIKKIGVFDLQFHPCYCEDSDYCYTAWENDIETVVTPNSIIYHDEGGTSGTDEDSGFKAYQKVNFEKFLTKHKHNLSGIADKINSLN